MMTHKERYAAACAKAFEGFEPDLTKSKYPDEVLLVRDLAATGMLSRDIGTVIGKSAKAVQKIFRRYNFPSLYNIEPPRREERIGWKGGVKTVNGYRYARTPGHPFASKHGEYVAEHRLVVEKKLGRFLQPHEVVDHIDGNRSNNAPENLRVFQSNAEHLAATITGKRKKMSELGREILRQNAQQRPRNARGQLISSIHWKSKTYDFQ
jgi:hypothetical protein